MAASWGANQPARALLFERLVARPDEWFGEPSRSLPEPRRTHDIEGLRASVMREVRSALATRCSFPSAALAPEKSSARPAVGRTTRDYGLPEIAAMAGRGAAADRAFLKMVRETIEAYEPRLRKVEVELAGPSRDAGRLNLRISAELVVDDVREPLEFDWSASDKPDAMGGSPPEAT